MTFNFTLGKLSNGNYIFAFLSFLFLNSELSQAQWSGEALRPF